MIQFKATEAQLKQIAANATNAARPMGMGYMQATNKVFGPDDFEVHPDLDPVLHCDYVQGRMVKLTVYRALNSERRPIADGLYEVINEGEPSGSYQSWCSTYRTWEKLLASVPGIEVMQ